MSSLPNISPEIFKAYQDELSQKSSSATARRKAISLKKFFNWAQGAGKIQENPIQPSVTSVVTNIKPKTWKVGVKTWAILGLTTSMAVLLFLFVSKVKLPIPFKINLAQESLFQTENQKPSASDAGQTPTAPNQIPANGAVIAGWNLFTKLTFTDINGVPQIGSQSISFKVFDSPDGTNELYATSPQTVTPDANGSALISLADVPTELFFKNNQLFLEPQIGSSSASVRIPVPTANTATSLNGYGAADPEFGAGPNSIPVINSDGTLMLAGQTPAIKAREGNLLVEGQAVTIKTADGSGGNLEFNPDGNGYAHFLFEGNKGNFLNVQGPNLTSGSLYYGMVPNNATGYNLINLQSGSPKMRTRFSVDATGNTYVDGILAVNKDIATGGEYRLTSEGELININGYYQSSGNFSISQNAEDYAAIVKNETALTDVLNLTLNEHMIPGSHYAALVVSRYGGDANARALVVNGNSEFNGQVQLGNYGSNPTAIGEGSIIYNTSDGNVYYWDGTSWVQVATGTSSFSGSFADLTSGTNAIAAMIVGTGASLTYSGSGTINASSLQGGTWAAPGTIGSGTPNSGAFTSLNVSGLTASKVVFTDASKNLTSTGTVGADQGGTGFSGYTVGDLLYADTTTTLAKLNDVATGNVLISGGVSTAPSWGKVALGTHTTGNYVSSVTGTANQITVSPTTGDAIVSIPSDFRAPGTVNAVSGIYTGATAGTQRIDATGNLTNIGTASISGTLTIGNGSAIQPAYGPLTLNYKSGDNAWTPSIVMHDVSGDIDFAGGSGSTGCTISNSAGTISCSGGVTASALKWNALTSPDGALTLNMLTNPTTFNWDTGTGANDLFSMTTDASSDGTGYLFNLATGTSSTVKPFHVSAGSVEAISVDASGNVGVGITNPSAKLDVQGTATVSGVLTVGNGTTNSIRSPYGPLALQFKSGDNAWTDSIVMHDVSGDIDFAGGSGSTGCTISNSAGTISCSAGVTASALKWNALTSPDGALTLNMLTNPTTFNWDTGTGASDLFSMTTDASSNGTGYLFNLATGTSSTVKPFHVAAGAVEAIAVDASGNVGMGVTNPTSKLVVKGTSSVATVGVSNLLTADGTFDTSSGWTAGSGWTIGSSVATHATGNTPALSGTSTATSTSTVYQVNFTVAVTTAGDGFTTSLGGKSSEITITTSGAKTVYIRPTSATGTLSFVPGSAGTFVGTVDSVTIYAMTVSTPELALVNSNGTTNNLELRSGGDSLYNTFVGYKAGQSITSGDYNTAFGAESLRFNTTGQGNVATGGKSLWSNIDGDYNTAFGFESLYSNIIGSYNTGIGNSALYSNTTGQYNSATGRSALYSNTSGSNNSATGYAALFANTTGGNNVANGMFALTSNSTGSDNTAVGYQALNSNTGGNNTAVGSLALYSITSGTYNTALGYLAGRYISGGSSPNQTSSNSLYLGSYTKALASGDTNEIVIGYNTTGIGSNTAVLGNDSILTTALKGNVGIGTTNPSAKLDVQGIATVSGILTVGNGTTNQIRSPYGSLVLQGKTGANTYEDSIVIKDISGNIDLAGGSTSTGCTISNSAGTISCSGGVTASALKWNALTSPDGALTLNMLTNPTTFNWDTGTGANDLFSMTTDASSDGTGYLFNLATGTSSTVKPFHVAAGAVEAIAVDASGNVGIGDTSPVAKLDVKDTSSLATLGTEMISATADRDFSSDTGKWTGTNWAVTGGVGSHTPAGANDFTLNNTALTSAPVAGHVYQISIKIITTTVGTLDVKFGGTYGTWYPLGQETGTSNQVIVIEASNTNPLTISPNGAWVGTIDDVSITEVTPSAVAFRIESSNGALTPVEFRAGGSNLYNTFVGEYAGSSNVSGYDNAAFGNSALYYNTLGTNNSAFGSGALWNNTDGDSNTAVGAYSLSANTIGGNNVAIGESAMGSNLTGANNVAVGVDSLYDNTVGNFNSAFGSGALGNNIDGDYNVAVGYAALNTGSNVGTGNIGIGRLAIAYNGVSGTADYNVGLGYEAMYNSQSGSNNVALGGHAGYYQANGSSALTSASNSIYLGYNAKGFNNSDDNTIVIGYNAAGIGANTVVLGNDSITTTALKGNVGIGTTSPSAKLDVQGTATVSGVLTVGNGTTNTIRSPFGPLNLAYKSGADTWTTGLSIQDTTGSLLPGTDNTQSIGASPSGRWKDIFLGPASLHLQAKTTDSGYSGLGLNLDYALGINTAGSLITSLNNSAFLALTQGGDLGLGTINPSAKLDVAGTATVSGILTVGNGTTNSIRSPYGPLALQFKSGDNAWTDSIVMHDVSGDIDFAGGSTSTGCTISNSAGTISCSAGVTASALKWNALTSPDGALTLNMLTNPTTFNWDTGTGASDLFSMTTDASSDGTGYLLNLATGTSSTVKPFHVAAGAVEAIAVDASGNVGMGTTVPYAKLAVLGTSSIATAGSNLLTADGGFDSSTGWTVGTNWSIGSSVASHSTGSSGTLTGTSTATSTVILYKVSFTLAVTTPGTGITVGLGGTDSGITFTSAGSKTVYITPNNTTGNLIFTAGSTFVGTVDSVAVYAITPSTPELALVSSNDTAPIYPLEFRTGADDYNAFIGYNAGKYNLGGQYNSAVGYRAMLYNVTGYENSAFGAYALSKNTTGYYNSAFGLAALENNIIGINNLAGGYAAMDRNETGNDNTGLGFQALYFSYSGSDNTGVGSDTLYSNDTGSRNTALGSEAGYSLGGGSNNLFLGYQAGDALTTGSTNIIIGYSIDLPTTSSSNMLDIGNLIYATGIDGTGTTLSTGNVGIGTTSPTAKLDVAGTATVSGILTVGNGTTNTIRSPFGPLNLAYKSGADTWTTGLSIQDTTGSLLPGTDNTQSIGASPSGRWKDIFLGPASLHLQAKTTDSGYSGLGLNLDYGFGIDTSGTLNTSVNGTNLMSITQGGNVGIGTTDPVSPLDIYSANASVVIGSSLISPVDDSTFITNTGNWSGTNWTVGSGVATHTTGSNTFTLSTLAAVSGRTYKIRYTVNTTTTGTIHPTFGGQSGYNTGQNIGTATGFDLITASSTAGLAFVPSNTWAGYIDNVYVYEVTSPAQPVLTIENSEGFPGVEIRAGGDAIDNTFIGVEAGKYVQNGFYENTAVGYRTLSLGLGPSEETALGAYALRRDAFGARNTALGFAAMEYNGSGTDNIAVGYDSLFSNTSGFSNVALGAKALIGNTSGNNNIAIGYQAGDALTTGNNNIVVGYNIDLPTSTTSNMLDIGNLIYATGIDGTGTTLSTGNVGIGTTSPTAKLDVAGTATVSGVLTVGNGTTNTIRSPYGSLVLQGKTGANTYEDSLVIKDISGDIDFAGGSGSTGCTISNSAGTISCSAGVTASALKWNALTSPDGALTLNMLTNPTTFNWDTGTGANDLFSMTTDASSDGTGYLMNLATGTSSTVKPLHVSAGGTDSLTVDSNGNTWVGGTTNTATASSTPVHSTVIEQFGYMFIWVDVALGPDGFARISTEGPDGNLQLVRCTNADCTTRFITDVESAGTGGGYSSIAIGADGFARISHYDYTNTALKFVQCTNADCTTSNVTTVDNTAAVGKFTSIALGSDGFARISYYDDTTDDLKFVQCTNASCSTSNIIAVDSTDAVGQDTSIALGSDGFARISYFDTTNTALKFVQCTNASCSTSNITTVDNAAALGYYSSIAIASDGFARISYMDGDNLSVKFARCTNAACTTSNINTIDSDSDWGYASIAIGLNGYPQITKHYLSYGTGGNDALGLIQCTNADCTTNTFTKIDSYSQDTGEYNAIVIGSDGYTTLAYTDYNGALMVARVKTASFTPNGDDLFVDGSVGVGGDIVAQGDLLINQSVKINDSLVIGNDVKANTLRSYSPWTISTIDTNQGWATASNNAITVGADNFARISYGAYDSATGSGVLKFIRCKSLDCTSNTMTVIDGPASNYFDDISILLGSDGFARISYYDTTSDDLKFIRCTNDDCTTRIHTVIDATGNVGASNSLALGTDGFARISYADTTNGDLKFVQCTNADCTTNVITVIDNASASNPSSLKMAGDGFARIAYIDGSGGVYFVQCTNDSCSTNSITNIFGSTGSSSISLSLGSTYPTVSISGAGDIYLSVISCSNAACTTSTRNKIDPFGNATVSMTIYSGDTGIAYSKSSYDAVKFAFIGGSCTVTKPCISTIDASAYPSMTSLAVYGGYYYVLYDSGPENVWGSTVKLALMMDFNRLNWPVRSFDINQSSLSLSGDFGITGDAFINGNAIISNTLELQTGRLLADEFNFTSDGLINLATIDAWGYMYIQNRIGVGISPHLSTAALDVVGSASISGTLAFRGTTDPKIDILNNENFGIRTSYSGGAGLTERFTITNPGNVGIGTTAPTALLDVAGTASVSAITVRGTSPGYINQVNGNNLTFRTSVGGDAGLTDRMTLTNAGNLGIGTTIPATKLAVQGATTVASLGSEKVTNGNFASDPSGNWTYSGTWTWDGAEMDYTGTTGAIATVATDGIRLNSGGTGYAASDVLTLVNGANDAQITVSSVDSFGKITGWTLSNAGTANTYNTNVAVTGGTGTGATFFIRRLVDSANTLSQNVSVTSGNTYKVTYTLRNKTTGEINLTLGGVTGFRVSTNGTYTQNILATGTGNLIFTPTADFTGTIDDVSVVQVTGSTAVASLLNSEGTTGLELRSGGNGLTNSFIGNDAGYSVPTGSQFNTAFGYQALRSNVTSWNTAVGYQALYSAVGAAYNTAVGYQALSSNRYGNENVAIGQSALAIGCTGCKQNVAIGANAMINNTGWHSVGVGYNALYWNQGSYNVAVGLSALEQNSTGQYNVAVGNTALFLNTTGQRNTAVGYEALRYNQTGSNNTALGNGALFANTTGVNNLALGYSALVNNKTGGYNTVSGFEANERNISGSYNVTSGAGSMYRNISGSYNVTLGNNAFYHNTSGNNNVAVGYDINPGNRPSTITTATAVAGAGLGIGTYQYKVSYVFGSQEAQTSDYKVVTTTGGNQQVDLSGIPTYSGGLVATARKIYRSKLSDGYCGGSGATCPVYLLTTINDNVTTTYSDTTADASLGAVHTGPSYMIALGSGASTYFNNQMSINLINDLYIGNGIEAGSPYSPVINASGGTGTNIAGGSLTLAGGKATGNAAGGSLIFSTSVAGASGTALQSLSERMRIDSAGNVGIGTTAPGAQLQIGAGSDGHSMAAGDIYGTGDFELDGILYLDGRTITSSNGTSTITFPSDPTAVNSFNLLTNGSWLVQNPAAGNPGIAALMVDQLKGGDIFTASASGSPKLTLTNAGKLGLGTTAPHSTLQSAGSNIWAANALSIEATDTTAQAANVGGGLAFSGKYTDAGDTTEFAAIAAHKDNGTTGNYGAGIGFYTRANGGGAWTSKTSARMFIDSSGNVGIGTTSPDALLDARGTTALGPTTNRLRVASGMGSGEKGLWISYGATTADKVTIQAEQQGSAYRDILINPLGGNVGIGTTDPSAKIEVGTLTATGTSKKAIQTTLYPTYTGSTPGQTYGLYNNITGLGDIVFPTIPSGYGVYNNLAPGAAVDTVGLYTNSNTNNFTGYSYGSYFKTDASSTGGTQYAYYADMSSGTATKWGLYINGEAKSYLSGNVGIGTTSPGTKLQVSGTDFAGSTISCVFTGTSSSSTASDCGIQMFVNDGAAMGAGDSLGIITMGGITTGSTSANAVAIRGIADSAWGSGDAPSDLTFETTPDGSATRSERMRIDHAGNVSIAVRNANSSNVAAYFTNTGILSTVASSIRFKENVTNYENVLDNLNQLRAVHFDWKNGSGPDFGMIAEEVFNYFPELVTYEDDGTTIRGLKYEKMGVIAIKGIQEQQAQIDSLAEQIGNVTLTDAGNLNISQTDTGDYQLTDTSTNSVIDRVGAFGQFIAANIKAGAIVTQKLVSQNLESGYAKIETLIAQQATILNINTKLISPVPGDDLAVELPQDSRFKIQDSSQNEVASIDSEGNATFAGEVHAQNIDEIQALLNSVASDQLLLTQAAGWNTNTATDSGILDQLAVSDLYVTNQAAVNSLSISSSLTIGSDLVFQSTLDSNSQILDSSINTLSGPLKIQSLAMAPVEIMAGLVTIDTQGNVQIAGNLYVAGKIKSSGLTLQDNNASGSAQLLSLQDQGGLEVGGVNASGSAQFNSLTTPTLVIAGSDATSAGTIIDGVITTNSTIGQAVIPAGVSEITIKNPKVTDYTLVYVTPTSTTQNYVLYVKSKQNGEFIVGFDQSLLIDVNFNWWIVQVQN